MRNEYLLELIMSGRGKVIEATRLLRTSPEEIDIFYQDGIFFDMAIQREYWEYLDILLSFLEENVLKENSSNRNVMRGIKFLSDLWGYLSQNDHRDDNDISRMYLTSNSRRIFNEYLLYDNASESSQSSYHSAGMLGNPDLLLEQDVFSDQFFSHELQSLELGESKNIDDGNI